MSAFDKVAAARSTKKLTSVDYINAMFGESFIELHGDRNYSDDKAVVGGVGMLNDIPVTVIGLEKGRNTFERMERNFGAAHPEGYRKALRLMKQAEKFHRPILTFVDTSGAFCGIGAEERGQGHAIATNLMEMMALKTPVLSIFIGEGGSGGALALAVCDELAMLENALYSVISPRGFASILWKDAAREREACDLMKITAKDLTRLGVCDYIIPEAQGEVIIAPPRRAKAADAAGGTARKALGVAFFFGFAALIAYEISEISINTFFINFMTDDGFMTPMQATWALSMGGLLLFMVGRVVGGILMSRVATEKIFLACAIGTVAMLLLAMSGLGLFSKMALIVLYVFESIMFPTIFALSIQGLGANTEKASSILMMSVVGGAIGPLALGYVADHYTMTQALVVPLSTFVIVLAYAIYSYARRSRA